PRLHADDDLVLDDELEAALLAAEAAVRLDDPVRLDARVQPGARRVDQVRAEAVDRAVERGGRRRHRSTPTDGSWPRPPPPADPRPCRGSRIPASGAAARPHRAIRATAAPAPAPATRVGTGGRSTGSARPRSP